MKLNIGNSNHCIYVDEQTNKGRQLVASNGILHQKITNVWKVAAMQFAPDLIIDIGSGFGDVLFSTEYHKEARIIGCEANKELEPFLKKSRKEHPNAEQIKLEHSLEQLLDTEKKYRKLLFKMNLHGTGAKALKVIENLTKDCEEVIGILDFNNIYLEAFEIRVEDFLSYLKTHFDVYILKSTRKLIKLQPLTLPNFKKTLKKPYIITDLLLVSDACLVTLLGYTESINYLDRGKYYLKD
ncbi:hypothetical protein [Bacillus sp. 1P02SD]|uniref:hypothetical protein n=1 Tax=Bacillus sp. 1P02SD TaxID=3132264 RepID=UPI0039A2F989